MEFHHHLSIFHIGPDDGPSRPEHAVSEIIRTFICVIVTCPFLFVETFVLHTNDNFVIHKDLQFNFCTYITN
jgi:hypothetical protein